MAYRIGLPGEMQRRVRDTQGSLTTLRRIFAHRAWLGGDRLGCRGHAVVQGDRRPFHSGGFDGQALRFRILQVLSARRSADPRWHGHSQGLSIERCFRDSKITELVEGTSGIQRLLGSR
jgi:alkylation response protein AidB-like acyl-CoA dehydrogenase